MRVSLTNNTKNKNHNGSCGFLFGLNLGYKSIPIQAYDARGNIVWECQLDIYGKVRNLHGEKTFIPFRYQGQYEDIETGLYYNRFRYYSPDTGTYISQDPIGLLGNNPNLYAYVHDVNSETDVFGLNKAPINLGGGFRGRLDQFNMGHGVDFEFHVYDKNMKEVGIFGSEGFMNKHGIAGADVDVPKSVQQRLKGMAVDQLRKGGRLGAKGTENIKGNKWKRPRLKGCN
ncbi:RHS repeat-associated core domain-containing protein [Tenacibaculum maritimum]|uniref:RHS repeat domain-containing protein n=1 Tax=Tenacibaculum maritimum TaxID=107401 RepID=UPI00293EC9ED|nr:RHS repeat-associated core domain-containing protein [Tenacibaculum maritimum]